MLAMGIEIHTSQHITRYGGLVPASTVTGFLFLQEEYHD